MRQGGVGEIAHERAIPQGEGPLDLQAREPRSGWEDWDFIAREVSRGHSREPNRCQNAEPGCLQRASRG